MAALAPAQSPLISVTVTSSPEGRTLTVDGAVCATPCSYRWTAGSSHSLAAATQAGAPGTQHVLAKWSDAGAAAHVIVRPSSDAIYKAYFTTQHYLATAATPPDGGTVSPASGWYNEGAVVSVGAVAVNGCHFGGFSSALTGITTPQNLAINAPASVTANFACSR